MLRAQGIIGDELDRLTKDGLRDIASEKGLQHLTNFLKTPDKFIEILILFYVQYDHKISVASGQFP